MLRRGTCGEVVSISRGVSDKLPFAYLYTGSTVVALDNFITKVAEGAEIGNYALSDQNRLSQMNLQKIAEWSSQRARPANISKWGFFNKVRRNINPSMICGDWKSVESQVSVAVVLCNICSHNMPVRCNKIASKFCFTEHNFPYGNKDYNDTLRQEDWYT